MKLSHLLSAAAVSVVVSSGTLCAIDAEFASVNNLATLKMAATKWKRAYANKPVGGAPAKLTDDTQMLVEDNLDGYVAYVVPMVANVFDRFIDESVFTRRSIIAATVGHLGDGAGGDVAVAAFDGATENQRQLLNYQALVHGVGAIGDGGAGDAAIAASVGGAIGDGGAGDAAIAAAALVRASDAADQATIGHYAGNVIDNADVVLDAVTAVGVNGGAHPMGGVAEPAGLTRGELKAAFGALAGTWVNAAVLGLNNGDLLVNSSSAEVRACKTRVNTAIFNAIAAWIDQVVPTGPQGSANTNMFAAGAEHISKYDVLSVLNAEIMQLNQ